MVTATRWEAARRALVQAEASTGVRTRLAGATALTGTTALAGSTALPGATALPIVRESPRAELQVDVPAPGVDPESLLPIPPALIELFPEGGLRRGSTVQVGGTSVLLALAAAAMGRQAWCALVDLPDVGLAAAAGLGLALPRVAMVPRPGPDAPLVLAAVVDGFDVVVLGRGAGLAARDRRALTSRVRVRGAVLLTTQPWAGADVVVEVMSRSWQGLGQGSGVLRTGELELRARHRRSPLPRTTRVRIGPGGLVAAPGPAGARQQVRPEAELREMQSA